MKQTVGYSESVEMFNPLTGLKKWVKVWNEKEINADEDRNAAFNDVQSFVQNKFHNGNDQQLTDAETIKWDTKPEYGMPLTIPPIPAIDRNAIDRLEKLIDDAQVLYDLQILQGQVAKYGLQTAYDNKLKVLSK